MRTTYTRIRTFYCTYGIICWYTKNERGVGEGIRLAKNAAQAMGADLFEIEPVHKYTDADLTWHDKKSLTTIECNDPKSRPLIANKIDISGYDTVILCYPIWWTYAPKIVYTFVERQNWSGKDFTCGSGEDVQKFVEGLK